MSKKGGYKIIDLKNNDLTSSNTIDGIYDAIEGNYGKPILLSGIVIDSVEKDDIFVNVEVSGSDYIIKAYDRTITITSSDVVTSVEGGNHLYEYNIILEFDNKNVTTQYVYFTLLSNKNLELTLDNVKTLIGDRQIMCTSTVTDLTTDLSDVNVTLIMMLYVTSDNTLIFCNISDEGEPEYTELAVNSKSRVTQLF